MSLPLEKPELRIEGDEASAGDDGESVGPGVPLNFFPGEKMMYFDTQGHDEFIFKFSSARNLFL